MAPISLKAFFFLGRLGGGGDLLVKHFGGKDWPEGAVFLTTQVLTLQRYLAREPDNSLVHHLQI